MKVRETLVRLQEGTKKTEYTQSNKKDIKKQGTEEGVERVGGGERTLLPVNM